MGAVIANRVATGLESLAQLDLQLGTSVVARHYDQLAHRSALLLQHPMSKTRDPDRPGVAGTVADGSSLPIFEGLRLLSLFRPPEDQRRVGSTETERVRKCHSDASLAGLVGHVIEFAFGVRLVQIDGRRQDPRLQRPHTE